MHREFISQAAGKPFIVLLPITIIVLSIIATLVSLQEERGIETERVQTALLTDAVAPAITLVESPKRYRFSIKTKVLPQLKPHHHEIEYDSIIDEGHGITTSSQTIVLPEDMWVVGYHTILHNAPYLTLHHNGLWRLDQTHPICKESIIGRHIYVAANDVAQMPVEFPIPYGMLLPKDTPLIFQAMLHNPLPPLGPGNTYEDVYVEVVIDFEKPTETQRSKSLEFYQLALEDEACDPNNSVFTVPANADVYTKTSKTGDNARYTFNKSGLIVAAGSHLHTWEGGKNVEVFVNNASIATLTTQLSSSEPWSWFSPRIFPFLRINKGDTISIAATYANLHDKPIRGAMGMIGFYFAPNDKGLQLVNP